MSVDPLEAETGEAHPYANDNPTGNIDPTGLCFILSCSTWDSVADASAGFGDTVTFGLTQDVREWINGDPGVNYCDPAYGAGGIGAPAVTWEIPGEDGAEAAGLATEDGSTAIEQAASKVPDEWGPGQPARSGGGWRWSDLAEKPGTNYIRVDPGNPDSSDPLQQVDHVHVSSGGVQVANHLPLDQWLQWGSWNAP